MQQNVIIFHEWSIQVYIYIIKESNNKSIYSAELIDEQTGNCLWWQFHNGENESFKMF